MTGTKKYLDKSQVKDLESHKWQWKAYKQDVAKVNKRLVSERIKFYQDF